MFEIVEETTAGASIKLVGVGGGGNNSVDAIYKKGLSGIECININALYCTHQVCYFNSLLWL